MKSNITDETIMPDGRPFFAWKNELAMLRNREPEANNLMKEAHHLMKLLDIANIEKYQEPHTGDIVIRFRMIDAVTTTNEDEIFSRYKRDSSHKV